MHYVYKFSDGTYVGVRKEIGYGQKRPEIAATLSEARVFNTKAAATNAAKAVDHGQGEVVPVAFIPHYDDAGEIQGVSAA